MEQLKLSEDENQELKRKMSEDKAKMASLVNKNQEL